MERKRDGAQKKPIRELDELGGARQLAWRISSRDADLTGTRKGGRAAAQAIGAQCGGSGVGGEKNL